MRNAPRRAKAAALSACVVGLVLAGRAVWTSYTGTQPIGKAVFYGLLMLGLFSTNGLAILAHSRLSYVLVIVFAIMPLLGSFAAAVHLIVLLVSGTRRVEQNGVVHGVVAIFLLNIIGYLLINLLSSEVRAYVWRKRDT